MSKKDETQEMLGMRLEGMTFKKIGEHFGITKQAVMDRLKNFRVSKRYSLNGAEASQDGKRRGVKGLLDKLVLRVKKFV